jgi:prepilin-type N-terminal cleavage/methylation domain-containing protein
MDDLFTSGFRNARRNAGHTLIELVVVLAILSLSLVFPAVSLLRGVAVVRNRGLCQVWQVAAAQAQIDCLWDGGKTSVVADAEGISLSPASGAELEVSPRLGPTAATANVSRWEVANSVIVTFAWPFASPNAAGSVQFGPAGEACTGVVRLESGLTRRVRN